MQVVVLHGLGGAHHFGGAYCSTLVVLLLRCVCCLALGLPCGFLGLCPWIGIGIVEPLHTGLSSPVEYPAACAIPVVSAVRAIGLVCRSATLYALRCVQLAVVNFDPMGAGKGDDLLAGLGGLMLLDRLLDDLLLLGVIYKEILRSQAPRNNEKQEWSNENGK